MPELIIKLLNKHSWRIIIDLNTHLKLKENNCFKNLCFKNSFIYYSFHGYKKSDWFKLLLTWPLYSEGTHPFVVSVVYRSSNSSALTNGVSRPPQDATSLQKCTMTTYLADSSQSSKFSFIHNFGSDLHYPTGF